LKSVTQVRFIQFLLLPFIVVGGLKLYTLHLFLDFLPKSQRGRLYIGNT